MKLEPMTCESFTDRKGDGYYNGYNPSLSCVLCTEDNFRELIEAHNELIEAFNELIEAAQ